MNKTRFFYFSCYEISRPIDPHDIAEDLSGDFPECSVESYNPDIDELCDILQYASDYYYFTELTPDEYKSVRKAEGYTDDVIDAIMNRKSNSQFDIFNPLKEKK